MTDKEFKDKYYKDRVMSRGELKRFKRHWKVYGQQFYSLYKEPTDEPNTRD